MQKVKPKKCKFCGKEFVPYNSSLQKYCKALCMVAGEKDKDYEKGRNRNFTVKVNKQEPLSEAHLFKSIWESLPPENRTSFITGKLLPTTDIAYSWYFSHVLPKGKSKYPMFKYYKKNIVLKTFEEHQEWEYHQYRLCKDSNWDHVFALKEELIQEYEEHLKLFQKGLVEYYKI